jgi:hypothetical protein
MRFRSAVIDGVARMICGDDPLPFPYRSSSALTAFFTGLGLDYVHRGESRNAWTRDALTAINNASPDEGDFPSAELVAIIEELMNRVYFDNSTTDKVDYNKATERLNILLRQYQLEVVSDSGTGVAKLHSVNGIFVSTASDDRTSIQKITFCPTVFEVPKQEVQDDLVAVMMPFAAQFTPVYETIKSACGESGLRCLRADDIWANSTIIQDIFDLIFVSSIVLVDFTQRNSNVMYETGIAHTLGKHVLPITQSMDDVPFDLQSHRVLKYLPNREGLGELKMGLAKRLATMMNGHSWE